MSFDVKIIDYNKMNDFVDKEGLFDRVIVDLRDTDEEEMNFTKIWDRLSALTIWAAEEKSAM